MKWFFIDESITDGERRQGPYSIEEIREFEKQGKITSETLVWHSGMENWIPWKEAVEKLEKDYFETNPEQEEILENTIKALEQIIETNKQNKASVTRHFTIHVSGTDGITMTETGSALVGGESYSLSGQRTAVGAKGVSLIRQRMSDGSYKTVKKVN